MNASASNDSAAHRVPFLGVGKFEAASLLDDDGQHVAHVYWRRYLRDGSLPPPTPAVRTRIPFTPAHLARIRRWLRLRRETPWRTADAKGLGWREDGRDE